MAESHHHAGESGSAVAYKLPVGVVPMEQSNVTEAMQTGANAKWSFFGNPCLVLTRTGACGGISALGKKASGFSEMDAVSNITVAGKAPHCVMPSKQRSDLLAFSKEDCVSGFASNEPVRTPGVIRTVSNRANGQAYDVDVRKESTSQNCSKEAEISVLELEEARRHMIASAIDKKGISRGDGSPVPGIARKRGQKPYERESIFSELGALDSLDGKDASHSDGWSQCKSETIKQDIFRPYRHNRLKFMLHDELHPQPEGMYFSKESHVKTGPESQTPPAFANMSSLADESFSDVGALVYACGYSSDQEKSSTAEPLALKALCSKRKAQIAIDDTPSQRKYGMSEKNERIIPIDDLFNSETDQNREEANWNCSTHKEGRMKKSDETKNKVSVTGNPLKEGSTHVNSNLDYAIRNNAVEGLVRRSFVKWMLSIGKGLAKTDKDVADGRTASARLLKIAKERDPNNKTGYADVQEKSQETNIGVTQVGKESIKLADQVSSYFGLQSQKQRSETLSAHDGHETLQNSQYEAVDCTQEQMIIHKSRGQTDEMVGLPSHLKRPLYRSEPLLEKYGRELYASPVLREGFHPSGESNPPEVLPCQARAGEKTLPRSLSSAAAKCQFQSDLSPAMKHGPSSNSMRNALHTAGAFENHKVSQMWINRYIAGSKLAIPKAQAKLSNTQPNKVEHSCAPEVKVPSSNEESYSESFHSLQLQDALKNGSFDVRKEFALKILAGLNKHHRGKKSAQCLEVLPGILYPTEGSGNLPSPEGIAEFAASMKAVEIWITKTASYQKECCFQKSTSIQICKFCGWQGHTFYECSETLECELSELKKRVNALEDIPVEIGDIKCLRCLKSGHWGAHCNQYMNGLPAHSQDPQKPVKNEQKNKLQTRDKPSTAKPASLFGFSPDVPRNDQAPFLTKNSSSCSKAHFDPCGPLNETKPQSKKGNIRQKSQARPNPSKVSETNAQTIMTNANLESPEEQLMECKGEEHAGTPKKSGEIAMQQNRKRRSKIDRQSYGDAQDSKRMLEKHFKKAVSPEDLDGNKAVNNLPSLLRRANENWPKEFLLSIPRDMLHSIESLRLSRADLWKCAGASDFGIRIRGFFLRLRFGHLDEELGGTGYRMGRIKGAASKNLTGKKKIAVSVDLGELECIVDGKFISNQAFTQLELINWWCGMRSKGKILPEEDELGKVFEQKCQWQLE